MATSKGYDGRGTIIAFSLDGITFTPLPKLDKLWVIAGDTEYHSIDCLDSSGAIDFPVARTGEGFGAKGPYDAQNPGIKLTYAWYQEARIIQYKITLVDHSILPIGRCSIAKFEKGPRLFELETTYCGSQEFPCPSVGKNSP